MISLGLDNTLCVRLFRLRYPQNIIGIGRGRSMIASLDHQLDAPQVGRETLSVLNISVREEKCAADTRTLVPVKT